MTTRRKLLIVDEDRDYSRSLCDQLGRLEEIDTRAADTGAAALDIATEERFDIIILNARLPDVDGREVCRLMRRRGIRAPIILLGAADSDTDTILGLEAGANDYIAKPCRFGILLARLRAQLRVAVRG